MADAAYAAEGNSAAAHAADSPAWQLGLLACGIVAPLLYVVTDVVAAMRWEAYSFRDQTISELNAIGAPTRTLTIVFLLISYTFLIGFGAGIWPAFSNRRLRTAGAALAILGVQAFWAVPFASMHVREAEESLTDTLHLFGLAIAGPLLLVAIGFGASFFGRHFRLYSAATVVVAVAFGAWSGMDGARIADDLPTPWVGIKERISVYSYQLWLAVFAILLLREHLARTAEPAEATGRAADRGRSAAAPPALR